MLAKNRVKNWLKRINKDSITKILSDNSHLTKVQLETLLIDALAVNISLKPLKYDEKARLRLRETTRGSFNRTLRQAKKNAVKSIYTILLLGYLGILEDPTLLPYIEIANKLKTYKKAYENLLAKPQTRIEKINIINMLRQELVEEFKNLIIT